MQEVKANVLTIFILDTYTLANSEDTDVMLHNAGPVLFSKIKTIFRNRQILKFRNVDKWPLKI